DENDKDLESMRSAYGFVETAIRKLLHWKPGEFANQRMTLLSECARVYRGITSVIEKIKKEAAAIMQIKPDDLQFATQVAERRQALAEHQKAAEQLKADSEKISTGKLEPHHYQKQENYKNGQKFDGLYKQAHQALEVCEAKLAQLEVAHDKPTALAS